MGADQIPFVKWEAQHADLASLHDIRIREVAISKASDKARRHAQSAMGTSADEEDADEGGVQTNISEAVNNGPDVLDHGLWTTVPVDLSEDDENDDFLFLPSYLIMLRADN